MSLFCDVKGIEAKSAKFSHSKGSGPNFVHYEVTRLWSGAEVLEWEGYKEIWGIGECIGVCYWRKPERSFDFSVCEDSSAANIRVKLSTNCLASFPRLFFF